MTEAELCAIEDRVEDCREAVNAEGSPMGRLMAWANGAPAIVREDVPRLVAEVRRLMAAPQKKELDIA